MTVDFEKIKQMSIKDVQREINRCFLTYNFEDAEVLYEIWKDHLDGKEYIKRKQIYLNKKIWSCVNKVDTKSLTFMRQLYSHLQMLEESCSPGCHESVYDCTRIQYIQKLPCWPS